MAAKTKQTSLDQIKADILKRNICPDLAKTAKQLVFGDGNPDADIVFIGEAPGKNEDEQGKPFVGAAGKFLDEMLGMIGLSRQDVYITNIVKYRPPNNRDPLPEEKAEFLQFLEAQLDIIQPKLVVTLGRHSLNCFLPDLSISRVHGQPKRIRMRRSKQYAASSKGLTGEADTMQGADKQDTMPLVILPLFHPAAALYNGGMRQTLIDDFSDIPVVIEKINELEKANK